jgi:hypothetical protein
MREERAVAFPNACLNAAIYNNRLVVSSHLKVVDDPV